MGHVRRLSAVRLSSATQRRPTLSECSSPPSSPSNMRRRPPSTEHKCNDARERAPSCESQCSSVAVQVDLHSYPEDLVDTASTHHEPRSKSMEGQPQTVIPNGSCGRNM